MTEEVTGKVKKKGAPPAVSMRLRPEEQEMFSGLEKMFDLYGATNAVRAAGRVMVVLDLSMGKLLEYLEEYERDHPDCEPVHFRSKKEETDA